MSTPVEQDQKAAPNGKRSITERYAAELHVSRGRTVMVPVVGDGTLERARGQFRVGLDLPDGAALLRVRAAVRQRLASISDAMKMRVFKVRVDKTPPYNREVITTLGVEAQHTRAAGVELLDSGYFFEPVDSTVNCYLVAFTASDSASDLVEWIEVVFDPGPEARTPGGRSAEEI